MGRRQRRGRSKLESNRIQSAWEALVTLDSLEFGAFKEPADPDGFSTTHVQILELVTDNVLMDFGELTIATDAQNIFTVGVSSLHGIAIEWKDTAWDVGIDNVNFTVGPEVAGVPEPATYGMVAGGLALLGTLLRRRRSC